MKRFNLIIFLFILMFFSIIDVDALEIRTGTIYRNKATQAKISFMTDIDCSYYYKVTSSNKTPTDIKTNGISGGNISKDTMTTINATLESGKEYVHILVDDGNNTVIKSVELPYNFYYVEDFELYNEDDYPLYYKIHYNGRGNAYQKVITTNQLNNNSGKVFSLNGNYSWSSDQRFEIDNQLDEDVAVIEADVKPLTKNGGALGLGQKDIQWVGSVARVEYAYNSTLDKNVIKYGIGDGDANTHLSDPLKTFNPGEWMKIKIVIDYAKKKFDYYINDVKVNSDYLDTHPTYNINYIGLSSGNSTSSDITYYDNVKVYTLNGSIIKHNVTVENDSNGTISVDKTSTNMDSVVTINDYPNTGYRLKDIVIKKSSDNSDITSLVNYNSINKTFIMPDYDVKVISTFELVSHTINVSSNGHSIITPDGSVNVLYGDNKTINIIPDDGYEIENIYINGVLYEDELVNNKLLLESIDKDYNIIVNTKKFIINNPNTNDNICIWFLLDILSIVGILLLRKIYIKM